MADVQLVFLSYDNRVFFKRLNIERHYLLRDNYE
jgi:hypothetical protein